MKTYEGLFIFSDSMSEEAMNEGLKRIQAEIEKVGGTVRESLILGRRIFARPLHKKEAGQYAQVIFEIAGDQMAHLRARFRLQEEIFRAQIVGITEKELVLRKAAKDKPPAPKAEVY